MTAAAHDQDLGELTFYVHDPDGVPLPGVRVKLSGPAGEYLEHTSLDGRTVFRRIPPGSGYQATFDLTAFPRVVHEDIEITAGRAIEVDVTMGFSWRELITISSSEAYCGWDLEEAGDEERLLHKLVPGRGCVLQYAAFYDWPNLIDDEGMVVFTIGLPELPEDGVETEAHRALYGMSGWGFSQEEEHDTTILTDIVETETTIVATVLIPHGDREFPERVEFIKTEPQQYLTRCLLSWICGEPILKRKK
jgi:hypothetical protein